MIKLILLGFVTLTGIFPSPVQGQSLSFFRTLPGSKNSSATLIDASGVYTFDDSLRKFALNGAAVWSRPYPIGQTAAWLASAASGLYAAGHTNFEAFVRLYDIQGNQVWTRQFGFAKTLTINRAIAADATGVYVAGDTTAATGAKTFYLKKYDESGTELWTKSLVDLDYGVALALDPDGVYLRTERSLRKYGSDGTEIWARTLDGSSKPFDMKANATGIYLTGYNAANGYFLSRLDSNGNELWIRYGQSGLIAVDANSVYVTAFTYRQPGQCESGSEDAFVVHYDSEGELLWSRQFGTHRSEYPSAIAADPSGVFIAGFGSDTAFLAKLERSAGTSVAGPHIQNECVVNAASYVGGAVSPGEIVAIFGSGIGPAQPVSARGDPRFGTTLAETRVLFDGVPAPLLHVSSFQITAVVPNAVAGKSSVGIQVEYRGVLSSAVNLAVVKTHIGIFSFEGSRERLPVVLNEDGTPNSPDNPAARGSRISIFATGGGVTNPETEDGAIVGASPPSLIAPALLYFPSATTSPDSDETIVETAYAGAVAGFVGGFVQIRVKLQESVLAGDVSAWLAVGEGEGKSGQLVMISVKER